MEINRIREKVKDGYLSDLPEDIRSNVMQIHKIIVKAVKDLRDDPNYSDLDKSSWAKSCIDEFSVMPKDKSDIGSIRVFKNGKTYKCSIQLTGHFTNHQYGWIEELLHEFMCNIYSTIRPTIRKKYDMTIINEGRTGNPYEGFSLYTSSKDAKLIWDRLDDRKVKTITESFDEIDESYFEESLYMESEDYDVKMTEKQAKDTLRTLSQDIINLVNKNGKKEVITQYTANIYANIITKNLLNIWGSGWKKFSIELDSYKAPPNLEFKTPAITQDFISRFISGRETLNGFLHRQPEIKIKMSPKIFHTMKNSDDGFYFFKSLIQYYDRHIEKFSDALLKETVNFDKDMKHLIRTTNLSGVISLPMKLLFVFDDVNMSKRDTFKITNNEITTINNFIKGISSNKLSSEKEKNAVLDNIEKIVSTLRESCENDDTMKALSYLSESVIKYYNDEYLNELSQYSVSFVKENTDYEWLSNPPSREIKYLQEKFGVKKLKKIPRDIVAYITIETECIKDANDKMMISSYCLGKLEIVEWYIELLDTGSKKYIVPHDKPYLESLRTQLLACFDKIMKTPIPKNTKNSTINTPYPKGYEG